MMKRKVGFDAIVGAVVLGILLAICMNVASTPMTSSDNQTIDEKSSQQNLLGYTHTVLAEQATATWCPYCPPVAGYLWTLYSSGQYDFYYIALVADMNGYANQRRTELGVTGYPTVVFDGGYTRVIGDVGSTGPYITALNSCGARTVANLDMTMEAVWLGNAKINVTVSIKNNDATAYTGHLHTYVTENVSRWRDLAGKPYRFAWIGSYAFNLNVNVPAGETATYSTIWDGIAYGFGNIVQENLVIIGSVFKSGTNYVDETAATTVMPNNPPDTPNTPVGKAIGFEKRQYTYSTETTEPENEDVYYLWDWGDGNTSGWLGPYPPGVTVYASYSWSTQGGYIIRVKAKDFHGAESSWSPPKLVKLYKLGDCNADGIVNFDDIDAFVLALTSGPSGYYAQYPNGYYYTADCNQDGDVDFADIDPFVALLIGS